MNATDDAASLVDAVQRSGGRGRSCDGKASMTNSASQWNPDWSTPVFSLEERERRWGRVRENMRRCGVDVLVCLPNTTRRDRGQQDARYLSQLGENCEETTVVFPLEGDVSAWQSRGGVAPASNWISEVGRAGHGAGATVVIPRLKELGFSDGTLGIAGLTGGVRTWCRSSEGDVNWGSVEMIREAFPQARIVSGTDVVAEARFQKSEEEIDFLRRGIEVAERSYEAVVEHAREGVLEREVFARMLYASASAGGSMPVMFGWTSGQPGRVPNRLEQPTMRKLAKGDVLLLEIEGRWAGYISQLDETFSIGTAAPEIAETTKMAWESFDQTLAALRPGASTGDLVKAGEVHGMDGRAVARLIMHGRGTGDDGPLVISHSRGPEVPDVEIKENCVFLLKPYVSIDGNIGYGRWGDTVVVRANGAERLGTRERKILELG